MNTPNNLEWLDEVLIQLPQYNCGLDPITEQPFTAEEHYAVYPELKTAKQTIATKLAEAYRQGYIDGGIATLTQDTKGATK